MIRVNQFLNILFVFVRIASQHSRVHIRSTSDNTIHDNQEL